MNRYGVAGLTLLLLLAWLLRSWDLDARPFHNDEAVNAIKIIDLWQEGRYAYDPDEYHGPTLHYATLPFLWLSGAREPGQLTDASLRWPTVVFGTALILLFWLLADGLGRPAVLWATLFAALSPALVFYSRYFIHETLLLCFTLLALGAGWRYARQRTAGWAAATGAAVGLMFATKETFVLTLAAASLAIALTALWRPERPAGGMQAAFRDLWEKIGWRHAGAAAAACLAVWAALFTSFFTHGEGLLDSARTYLPWIQRAGGDSPHIHPWYFYLQRLAWFHPVKGPAWSEGVVLALALVGAAATGSEKRTPLHRFLVWHTIILTAIYSLISYKTPWCLLNFYVGMILLAGVGAAAVMDWCRAPTARYAALALVGALAAQLGWQAWRAGVVYPADRRNPYVYAQTAPNTRELAARMDGIAKVADDGHRTIVKVIAPTSDYWPLPWYLRRFERVGWYDQLPEDPFAPMVVVASKLDARLDDRSEKKWVMVGLSELRPLYYLELYVELELWKRYVATLPRPQD